MEVSLAVYEEITGLPELPPPVDEADYERRKYRRVPFGHRATITPIGTPSSDGEAARDVVVVRDVSISGMSFLHTEAIRPGTPFLIEFRGHHDRSVTMRCIAARCEPGGSGGMQFVIGAAFDELLTKELPAETDQEISKLSESKPLEDEIPALDAQLPDLADEPVLVQENGQPSEQPTATLRLVEAPATATAPPPRASALFKTAPAADQKKSTDGYWHETAQAVSIPVPAAPAPQISVEIKPLPPQEATVFRVVPLPDPPKEAEPAPVVITPAQPVASPAAAVEHHGKSQDILARVKELLVQQERTIESQRVQISEHRRHFETEIESLRAELNAAKAELAEARAKSAADDSALADLATFLDQHRTQAA